MSMWNYWMYSFRIEEYLFHSQVGGLWICSTPSVFFITDHFLHVFGHLVLFDVIRYIVLSLLLGFLAIDRSSGVSRYLDRDIYGVEA